MPYADNDGVKIWFEVEGDGPPLLLVHGTTGNLENWRTRGVVDALKSDYKLILIDVRGHGRSDKPHDPAAYLPEPKSKDIEAVLDELAIETTHFLGYSLGGRVGFDVVANAPHRLRSLVVGGAGPSSEALLASSLFVKGVTIEDVVQKFEAIGGPMPEQIRNEMLANDIDAIVASLDHSILDQEDRYREVLSEFQQPALLFVGTEDERHDDVEKTVRQMPNAEFIALDGIDHMGGMVQIARIMPQIKAFLDSA